MRQRWEEILKERLSTILDGLLGMALGLSAYSLTDFTVNKSEDITIAIIYFAFTFFVILIFWGEIFRVFAAVLYYDETLLWGTIILNYSITLLPFFFQLVLFSDPMISKFGMTLFPVFMSLAAILNSTLFVIALKRRVFEMPKDDILEMKRAAFGLSSRQLHTKHPPHLRRTEANHSLQLMRFAVVYKQPRGREKGIEAILIHSFTSLVPRPYYRRLCPTPYVAQLPAPSW